MGKFYLLPIILSLSFDILICALISIIFSKYILEFKHFIKNTSKIKAKIIDYTFNQDADLGTSYSPIYCYNHPTLGDVNLNNNIHYYVRPTIGITTDIYYNTDTPYSYYTKFNLYRFLFLIFIINTIFFMLILHCCFY